MISLVAMSIDAMLPALPKIGHDLGVERANDTQLIISLLLLGLSAGQILYGPLSDSIGRKPAIYAGYGLFSLGCLLSIFATSFNVMLAGRILQGIGVAGPRVVTVAIVRDQYEGRAMARVMSFVMAVFILVPAVAPSLGQGILILAHWRVIFGMFLALALLTFIWFAVRQPETLVPNRRIPFSLKRIARAVREVCANRIAFGYTLALGFVTGAFVGYLSSTQQILQEHYGLGRQFPLYFSVLALAIGSASFLNARLVMRLGMRSLTSGALHTLSGLSLIFFAISYPLGGNPPLWTLMTYFMISFFCIGILFGNLNALAMEPLGHIAGVGAAVVGSLSSFMGAILGFLIGQGYNDTILPLVGGFAILSATAIVAMRWAEDRKQVSQYGNP
jgi:DHA1 family bicyclomycin/chloramphenicol resistance-like MFS transporter